MENDELARHLESLRREDCYRVDAVLKQSAHEVTQRVFFMGENGAETGPYIRKFIRQEPGMGAAYMRIFEAQQDGHRFKYVPDILECYARNGFLVVVMECVRGETLQEVVYRLDPSPALAADIFPRLCDAVSELHAEFDPPIVHRDLKPSNIILSQAGLAIIDFGIAREFKGESESDTTHFGTRGFAPPEQFGFGQTTVRSDVYSLGMVLFYLLAETIPDAAAREAGFADPRVAESMRQVICKAAAFDPDARYASAQELKAAFAQALASPSQRVQQPGQRSTASGVSPGAHAQGQRPGVEAGMPADAAAAASAAGAGFPAGSGIDARAAAGAYDGASAGAAADPTVPAGAASPVNPAGLTEPAEPEMRFRVLGEIWNVLLAALVIGMFFLCGTRAAHPEGAGVNNPPLANYLIAYLYIWPCTIALALLLSDKRRLKLRFPRLARFRWWQWLALFVAFVFVLILAFVLLARPLGIVSFDI